MRLEFNIKNVIYVWIKLTIKNKFKKKKDSNVKKLEQNYLKIATEKKEKKSFLHNIKLASLVVKCELRIIIVLIIIT